MKDKAEEEIKLKQKVEMMRKADKVEVARNLLLEALIMENMLTLYMQGSRDTT